MSGRKVSNKLAKAYKLPDEFVYKLMLDILHEIECITVTDGRCQIRGFGTFRLKTSAPRKAFNVVTKEISDLDAKTTIVFDHGQDRKAVLQQQNGF